MPAACLSFTRVIVSTTLPFWKQTERKTLAECILYVHSSSTSGWNMRMMRTSERSDIDVVPWRCDDEATARYPIQKPRYRQDILGLIKTILLLWCN